MPPDAYRELLAASNMKQRTRKLLEYTWADRLSYAVAGTPNLLEYDQGFFVKGGDGLADLKPIAGLYKGQVYALARELGLPESVATRYPTTDTFSLPQTQEEFYFGHPYDQMDLLMWGHDNEVAPADLAARVGLEPGDIEAAYREIERMRVATEYLHAPAVLVDPAD
jgi:NAD+ synthase